MASAAALHTLTAAVSSASRKAHEDMKNEMARLTGEPVSTAELSRVKNYLSGTFVMGLETQSGLANQLAAVKLMGLPENYLETYTARVRSVDPARIQSAARKYLAPDVAGIVVVGDASQIGKAVEKLGTVAIVKAE